MGIATLLTVFLVLVLVLLPIWLILKITALTRDDVAQRVRLLALENEVARLRRELTIRDQTAPPPLTRATPLSAASPPVAADSAASAKTFVASVTPAAAAPSAVTISTPIGPISTAAGSLPPAAASAVPPVIPLPGSRAMPAQAAARGPNVAPKTPAPVRIDWEQFMGAKLFAWSGGLAAFLAVAFFVKYSFEHDLIPPEVRVAIGFVLSAALVAGGLLIRRARYRITAQVLCATGIVSLYAVTFACNSVYHFEFFGTATTFLLMALITAAAFLLAVRMEAPVVAILGLLGGFLTPILLSTGRDNPLGLFGYIALLNAGLIAVALHRRWFYLVSLAAGGTVLTQIGWAAKFLETAKVPTAVAICLSFCALFFIADEIGRRLARPSRHLTGSAAALAVVALAFALVFFSHGAEATRPALWLPFVFFADGFLLALAWRAAGAARLHLFGSGAVFVLLALWTAERLNAELLPWALAAYLLFAVLHSAFPLVLSQRRPEAGPTWWSQVYTPLTLLLLLGPILKIDSLSLLYWPAVLAVDVLAVVLALFSASLVVLGVVLVFTLATAAVWILQANPTTAEPFSMLVVVAGFAAFFFAASLWLSRRLGDGLHESTSARPGIVSLFGDTRAQIPAFSALLPFALLVLMSQQLALSDPSPLFGLALLLVVLVLGLARMLSIPWLPLCGLAGVAALEYAWHARHFTVPNAATPLPWYLGFYVTFTVFPFVFRRRFSGLTGPWAVAALSGVVHFPLVHRLISQAWPSEIPGVLPALFALPPLVSLVILIRRGGPTGPGPWLNQLAWFGGAALFFITLVFPIQFEREWITLGWALEGAALLWLFVRVPHPGLRATGVALLVAVFARLALNQEVLSYHPRNDTPIFNWYLYAYGVAVLCLFAGARWLRRAPGGAATERESVAPPPDRGFGVRAAPLLEALGTVLAFLLLNLEIADYFSPPGRTLTFDFSDNFPRNMAYTIGWSLFALGLLGAGIWKHARAARIAAISLLSVTLVKLFFHDLDHLAQLYRVGALIVVATVAIVASFLYQRFIPARDAGRPNSR